VDVAAPYLTPEQYLEFDRKPGERPSEYVEGQIHPVPKAGPRYKSILANLTRVFNAQLAMSRCKLMVSPIRVRIPGGAKYMHPSLITVCGRCEFEDSVQDTVANPILVLEIASPTAEDGYDRGAKGDWYRSIPTLRTHIVVADDRVAVTVYTRERGQDWSLEDLLDVEDVLDISAINAKIPLAQIYQRIEFDDPS
jgi:Uma2 family endonuclease